MEPKIDRLIFRTQPHWDESFMGYLLRLMELNSYPTATWILQLAKIRTIGQGKLPFVFNGNLDLSHLSKLTLASEPTLSALLYHPAPEKKQRRGGDYMLFENAVPQYLIRVNRPKVCTGCLRQSGYLRKVWEFSVLTACPIHRCLLIDTCPNCQQKIAWVRPGAYRCRCQVDWRRYSGPRLPGSELHVARLIFSLLKLDKGQFQKTANRISPLTNQKFFTVVKSLVFIACQFAGQIDTSGKYLAPSRTNQEIHKLLCKAAPVFDNWPNNFYSFLDGRRSEHRLRKKADKARRIFAGYNSALFRQLPDSDFEFLRAAYKKYRDANSRQDLLARAQKDKRVEMDLDFVRLNAASRLLKMTPQSLLGLVKAGQIKGIAGKSNNENLVLVDRKDLERLRAELEDSIVLERVPTLLGITIKSTRRLVTHGLLVPLRGPSVDGNKFSLFSKSRLQSLLSKIRDSTKIAKGSPRRLLSFENTLRKFRRFGSDIGPLLQFILDGKISPKRTVKRVGFSALQFDGDEVSDLLKKEIPGASQALSVRDAAARLHTSNSVVYALIKQGSMPARRSRLPPYGLEIEKTALNHFISKYVLVRSLASELRTGPAFLARLLISNGVSLLSAGGTHKSAYVVKRVDLNGINLVRAIAESKKQVIRQRIMLDRSQTADLLGISIVEVSELIARGVLTSTDKLHGRPKDETPYFPVGAVRALKGKLPRFRGLISATSAADMLKVSRKAFSYYVKKGSLKVALTCGNRHFYCREGVIALISWKADFLARTMDTQQVAKYCDVTGSCLRHWRLDGLLKPVAKISIDGTPRVFYSRSDVERLQVERAKFKAKRIREGKSSRFGRRGGPQKQPSQELIGQRLAQLVENWTTAQPKLRVTGGRLHKQLLDEGYDVGVNTVYVSLRTHKRHQPGRHRESSQTVN